MRGLAARVNRSLGYVTSDCALRHEEVTTAVEQGVVTKSAGAAIASLPQREQREQWLERARAGEQVQPADVMAKPARRGPATRMHRTAGKGRCADLARAEPPDVQTLDTRRATRRKGPRPSRWRPCLRTHRCPADTGRCAEQDEACAWPHALLVGRRPAEKRCCDRSCAKCSNSGGAGPLLRAYWPSCQIRRAVILPRCSVDRDGRGGSRSADRPAGSEC